MRRNGGLIQASKHEPTDASAKGVWDAFDQHNFHKEGKWPLPQGITSITNSSGNSYLNEGDSLQINVTSQGFQTGTTLYFLVTTPSGSGDAYQDVGGVVKIAAPTDASGNITLYIDTVHNDGFRNTETLRIENVDSSFNTFGGMYLELTMYGGAMTYLNKGNIGSFGTSGHSVTKNKTAYTRAFPNWGHPSGTNQSVPGYVWGDWGNDVFDYWGNWHFWHDTHGLGAMSSSTLATATASSTLGDGAITSTLNSMTNWVTEGSDGTINTIYMIIDFSGSTNNDSLKKIFKMMYGYIAQGVYFMEFSWPDNWSCRVCMGGNMGSDGNTVNNMYSNFSNRYSNQNAITLYSNYNAQYGSSYEIFTTSYRPRIDSENAALNRGIQGDNLYLWTNNLKHGCVFYFSKALHSSVDDYINLNNGLFQTDSYLF